MESAHQKGVLDNNIIKDKEKESLLLNTKALNIIWGGTTTKERYWRRRKDDSSDFIELVGVYWLEVSGKVPLAELSPKTYNLSFSLKFTETSSGWDNSLVIFKLQLPGQKAVSKAEKFSTYLNNKEWLEAPEGGLEFTVPQKVGDNLGMLTFTMYEIEREAWKQGLLIKNVTIKPQNL